MSNSPTPSLVKNGKEDFHHVEELASPKNHINVGDDYANNVNAKIRNPLLGISKPDLLAKVTEFCKEHDLEDKTSVFRKGALVAQHPESFEDIEELDEEDKITIREEKTHKWRLPWVLYYTVAICSLGSAIQGWDNTGANGANLSFPKEFGIEDNTWLVGFVNAAPGISGLMSTWVADPMNNWVGRRGVIFITGLFVIFPVLGQAFTHNWWSLLICRLLMGFGMGIKTTTIPIMTSEIVPAAIRGGLVMSFQLFVAFGILVGFCSNLIFYRIGPLAWRFQLAAAFAPAVPIVILIWFCPESPRWLLKKHRYKDSFRSFCRLRNSEVIAARDLYYAYCQFVEEEEAFKGTTLVQRAKEIFTIPRIRRANLGGAIVMVAQQFSGINIMSFYSSTIFKEAGSNTLETLLASFGFGLVNFIFAFPAIWTIDTFGRRNLLLFTFPNMAWCLVAAGCCFLIPAENSARLPLIAFFVYLFTALYSPGIGPVPNVYASECFPLSHREIGVAFSIFINNTLSSILGLTFPSILSGMGPTGAFGFYAGLNMVAFVIIFFFLPETKQRTLEELDYIFGVPTRRHAAYQTRTWLPWFIKRYILFQSNARLEPLYHLEGFSGGTTVEVMAIH
ncbi:hypothetical protein VF21_02177 [Pseudogymnoascus sp. 05NY08]|nr:hypothetical protein VF21_02177 [Pseudogymnoascus sp. 05NY08]